MKSSQEKVMGHTEGKLTWGLLYISQPENHGSYKQLAMHPSGVTQEEGGQWEYDARRLVTCWNEHDGLVHDNAQLYQSLQGEMKGRLEAEAERDELVKALRSARDYLDEQYPMVDASELLEEIDPILSRYPENEE